MKIEADLHVHTVASGHAYSTVEEITKEAAKKGLKMVAITDHGPGLPGGAHLYHFWNLRIMPQELNSVRILKGVEANIVSSDGELDLTDEYLEPLELVHAGFHPSCGYESGSAALNTKVLIKVMDNPLVDFIVHPGNWKFPIDPETLVDAALEKGMALEINNSSFLPTSSRNSARSFDLPIANLAYKKRLQVIISSDAHIYTHVGVVDKAVELAVSAGLDEEQIINTSVRKVLDYLTTRRAQR
ncbi:MAG: phosphatase [Actinobacteria bacterium]|nr:phosphatase [Actinomycetota bacterium]